MIISTSSNIFENGLLIVSIIFILVFHINIKLIDFYDGSLSRKMIKIYLFIFTTILIVLGVIVLFFT